MCIRGRENEIEEVYILETNRTSANVTSRVKPHRVKVSGLELIIITIE